MQPRGVPVIQSNTETAERPCLACSDQQHSPIANGQRRAGDRCRLCEVRGASHVSNDLSSCPIRLRRNLAALERISIGRRWCLSAACTRSSPTFPRWACQGSSIPTPIGPARWPRRLCRSDELGDDGGPPPHAARIEETNPLPAAIMQDRLDNAVGGLWMPRFGDVSRPSRRQATWRRTDASPAVCHPRASARDSSSSNYVQASTDR
jgi:hypothetical protein